MKKLLTTIIHTILILALLAVAALSALSLFPIPGHVEMKIVQSGSMEPAIHTGSIVVIQPANEYGVGDVITFGEDTKVQVPTTHRITSVRLEGNTTYFTTKGDANEEADTNEVAKGDVIGRVLFSVPYLGYLIDFSKKPIGFILLIVIPAILIILYELLGIYEEIKKHAQKKNKDSHNEPTQSVQRYFDISAVPMPVRVQKQRLHALPVAFVALLFPLTTTLLGGSGSTILFFSDSERSVGNLFDAGRLDIALSVEEATEASLGLGEEAGHTVVPVISVPPQTLPFSYTVDAVAGGNSAFCNALQVMGTPPPLSYNGSVNGFSVGTTSDQTPWQLHFFVPDTALLPIGAQCMVTLTYDAFQDGGQEGIEYHDSEHITLLFTFNPAPPAAPLQRSAALNEFMVIPDASTEEVLGTTTEEIALPESVVEPEPANEEPVIEEIPEESAVLVVPQETIEDTATEGGV